MLKRIEKVLLQNIRSFSMLIWINVITSSCTFLKQHLVHFLSNSPPYCCQHYSVLTDDILSSLGGCIASTDCHKHMQVVVGILELSHTSHPHSVHQHMGSIKLAVETAVTSTSLLQQSEHLRKQSHCCQAPPLTDSKLSPRTMCCIQCYAELSSCTFFLLGHGRITLNSGTKNGLDQ